MGGEVASWDKSGRVASDRGSLGRQYMRTRQSLGSRRYRKTRVPQRSDGELTKDGIEKQHFISPISMRATLPLWKEERFSRIKTSERIVSSVSS